MLTLTMLVKKPRFLIILVCNNSCCLYITIIVSTLVLVAHNGFAFDFPILLAEVERHPELDLFNFQTGNVHFSDTLPLLRKVATFIK